VEGKALRQSTSQAKGTIMSYSEGNGAFKEQAFDPETVKVLTTAFECSRAQLNHSDRSDPLIAEFVAKLIIEFAHQGERDPARLSERVLECLKA